MYDLNQKIVIVTGASRGIGLEIIKGLAAAGARPYCLDLAQSDDIRSLGLEFIECNVADNNSVESAVAHVVDRAGQIDALVNNAGIQGEICELINSDVKKWKASIEVNLFGTYHCSRCVLPHMVKHGRGKIINMSGGGATAPRKYFSSYAASKVAIVRLTETLAVEVAGRGIDVNVIAPGAINTSMLNEVLAVADKVGDDLLAEALKQRETGGSPVAKTVELVQFLVSSVSDGITGRLISAVHDDWRSFSPDKLKGSDWFTLRRVDPYLFTIKR